MHRHGYKGRKFGRERDQREALIKALAESLIMHGSIHTTQAKAKEVLPYLEKLITKAKKADLHNRRQIIAALPSAESARKLVDDIAPALKGRTSGYLRIKKGGFRRGDLAPMADVQFVDSLSEKAAKPETKPEAPAKEEVAAKPVKRRSAVRRTVKKETA